jgi:hypothetical protein
MSVTPWLGGPPSLDQNIMAPSCSDPGTLSLREPSPWSFDFSMSLSLGTVGAQPAAAVFLTVYGADGGQSVWTAPSGACQITFDSDVCSPIPSSPRRYVISGRGTCSQPATAAGGGPAAPSRSGPSAS